MHKQSTFSTKLKTSHGGSYGSVTLLPSSRAFLWNNKTQEAALISLGFQVSLQEKKCSKTVFSGLRPLVPGYKKGRRGNCRSIYKTVNISSILAWFLFLRGSCYIFFFKLKNSRKTAKISFFSYMWYYVSSKLVAAWFICYIMLLVYVCCVCVYDTLTLRIFVLFRPSIKALTMAKNAHTVNV